MLRPIVTVIVVLLAAAAAGCGDKKAAPTTRAAPITIARQDRAACTLLYARLQRVSSALRTSSELIAHSLNKRQLAYWIGVEEVQLRRSAQLMANGPVPSPLVAADRQLVAALRVFARDFARARAPARRGDFQAASEAMNDPATVRRILGASKTIENACK
jgi:hypothetical protein